MAELDAAAIRVVEITPVSLKSEPPLMFVTASSIVPLLFMASTTKRDWIVDTVPNVAVDGTTTEIDVEFDTVVTVPLPIVADLKSSTVGLNVIVSALLAAEAVMG